MAGAAERQGQREGGTAAGVASAGAPDRNRANGPVWRFPGRRHNYKKGRPGSPAPPRVGGARGVRGAPDST